MHFKVRLVAAPFLAMALLSHAAETDQPTNRTDQPTNRTEQTDAAETGLPENPMVGLALAPSYSDVKNLATQIQEAEENKRKLMKKIVNGLLKDCEGKNYTGLTRAEARNVSLSVPTVQEATAKVKQAKKALANAKKYYELEKKREDALPALVQKIQKKANEEYRRRVKAEEAAMQARMAADAAQNKTNKKLMPYREAVNRQRMADRLRAAEDVAMARQAVLEAAQARKLKAAEKSAKEMVKMARQAHDEIKEKVTLAATRGLSEKEKILDREIQERTDAVYQETAKYKDIQKEAKKLRLKSQRSAVEAEVSRWKANKAYQEYDNVRQGLVDLAKVKSYNKMPPHQCCPVNETEAEVQGTVDN